MTIQTLVHAPSEDITPHDKIPYRANLDAALLALKPETKRAYTRALRQYATFCTLHGWEVTPQADVLEAWQADMRGRGLAPKTISQSLAAVRWAARKARRWNVIDAVTLHELSEVHAVGGAGVRLGRWLTMDELQRLIRAPRGQGAGAVRDRAMLAMLAGCGLRRMELCRLTFAHLEERDGEPTALVNLVGKRDRVRSVAIPRFVRPWLASWLRVYRDACPVTPQSPLLANVRPGGLGWVECRAISPDTVYRVLASAAVAAGLPDVAPHDLRRSAAKAMQDGGAGLHEIRDVLGHTSVSTTERYLATAAGPALGTLAMDRLLEAR